MAFTCGRQQSPLRPSTLAILAVYVSVGEAILIILNAHFKSAAFWANDPSIPKVIFVISAAVVLLTRTATNNFVPASRAKAMNSLSTIGPRSLNLPGMFRLWRAF